jgi:spermidine/putrescine ABC transporter ATP-binding subunit
VNDVAGQGACEVEMVRVTHTFEEVPAVHDITLPVRRGEFLTLLGPSGCGKTTLLNIIAGFIEPTSGRVCIGGCDVTSVPAYQRDTGMVFQNYALFPHMNVFENVAFGLRMRRVRRGAMRTRVQEALEMVKLTGLSDRRVRQLSGGQQQRVALARAIVVRPRVLLLDEPLSALDKNLRSQMQVELKELHRKTGLTTVFVTHDQGEALSLSDRIVVMTRGEIQQIAAPIELYRQPANSFVASFIGEINHLPTARVRARGAELEFELSPELRLCGRHRPELRLRDGAPVQVFVRPEHIAVADAEGGALNTLSGRVCTHIYQGTHTLTRVAVDGLGVLEMRVPGGEIIERSPVDARIAVTLNLDDAILLPGEGS